MIHLNFHSRMWWWYCSWSKLALSISFWRISACSKVPCCLHSLVPIVYIANSKANQALSWPLSSSIACIVHFILTVCFSFWYMHHFIYMYVNVNWWNHGCCSLTLTDLISIVMRKLEGIMTVQAFPALPQSSLTVEISRSSKTGVWFSGFSVLDLGASVW